MAIQAEQYQDNLAFAFYGGDQEWLEMGGSYSLQNQRTQISQIAPIQYSIQGFAPSMGNDGSFATHVEKQKQEIDRFIILQSERFRAALQEQRKQHMGMLIKTVEAKTMMVLREKEEAIERSNRKNNELQNCLVRIEMENRAWQKLAIENESMVIALSNTLKQVRENFGDDGFPLPSSSSSKPTLPSSSSSSSSCSHSMVCKCCNSQDRCMLFLPCRHLCACKSCEAGLNLCPVCKSMKKSSIEVYMS